MAVYRVHKTQNYTVVSNTHLRDGNLTLKAKGLLTLMLSLPDNWKYSISGLVACTCEGETAVKSALGELKKQGYVVVTKIPPSGETGGRFTYQYDIYEQPQIKQTVEKQGIENLPLEILPLENQAQLNTDISSTDLRSTDKQKGEKRKRFVPPTIDEVRAYCLERKNGIDPQSFIDYYAARNWYLGKTKMQDWKAAVRTWENRRKADKPQQGFAYNDYTEDGWSL